MPGLKTVGSKKKKIMVLVHVVIIINVIPDDNNKMGTVNNGSVFFGEASAYHP